MVKFVLDENARPAPKPPGAAPQMVVKLAFGDAFDQDRFELLFEACFTQLTQENGGTGIFVEEDQHERGVLYPHLGPPYDDENDDQCMACVFNNGEGRTFVAMDGAWSVRCKAWIDGHHHSDHQDFHVILTGETLLRVIVELRPDDWQPEAGIYSVVESTCPFWEGKKEVDVPQEGGSGQNSAAAAKSSGTPPPAVATHK